MTQSPCLVRPISYQNQSTGPTGHSRLISLAGRCGGAFLYWLNHLGNRCQQKRKTPYCLANGKWQEMASAGKGSEQNDPCALSDRPIGVVPSRCGSSTRGVTGRLGEKSD